MTAILAEDGAVTALYTIPVPPPGRLSIMPRPRGGARLSDELRALREAGVDVLVCLLPRGERLMLGLAAEPAAAAQAGLVFLAFPIRDFTTPDRAAAAGLVETLAARLAEGRHVAIHCRGGIGRSPLIAAALLVRLGTPAEQAWQVVSAARGRPVPETDAQRRWLATPPAAP
jgi:protein-tyrosine phosphatase